MELMLYPPGGKPDLLGSMTIIDLATSKYMHRPIWLVVYHWLIHLPYYSYAISQLVRECLGCTARWRERVWYYCSITRGKGYPLRRVRLWHCPRSNIVAPSSNAFLGTAAIKTSFGNARPTSLGGIYLTIGSFHLLYYHSMTSVQEIRAMDILNNRFRTW